MMNNIATLGYVIEAMERFGYTEKQIDQMIQTMFALFGEMTEQEAEA